MLNLHYKTKKELKASVGEELNFSETNAPWFGADYPENGTGRVTGTNHPKRSWWANVTLVNHVITKVE